MSAYTDERIATQDEEQSATGSMRKTAGTMLIVGAVLCFTPLMPMGLLTVGACLLILLFSPAVEVAEENCRAVTQQQVREGTGNGCASFLWACFVAFLVVAGAIFIALMGTYSIIGGS